MATVVFVVDLGVVDIVVVVVNVVMTLLIVTDHVIFSWGQ